MQYSLLNVNIIDSCMARGKCGYKKLLCNHSAMHPSYVDVQVSFDEKETMK